MSFFTNKLLIVNYFSIKKTELHELYSTTVEWRIVCKCRDTVIMLLVALAKPFLNFKNTWKYHLFCSS